MLDLLIEVQLFIFFVSVITIVYGAKGATSPMNKNVYM
jgi:hypothetical protein